MLAGFGFPADLDSVVVYSAGEAKIRSDAALYVIGQLQSGWSALSCFRLRVPEGLSLVVSSAGMLLVLPPRSSFFSGAARGASRSGAARASLGSCAGTIPGTTDSIFGLCLQDAGPTRHAQLQVGATEPPRLWVQARRREPLRPLRTPHRRCQRRCGVVGSTSGHLDAERGGDEERLQHLTLSHRCTFLSSLRELHPWPSDAGGDAARA